MFNFFSRRTAIPGQSVDFGVKNNAVGAQSDLEKEGLLREAAKIAKVGGWKFDVATMKQVWTDEVYRIHEVDPRTFYPDVASGENFYTPKSRPIIEAAVNRAIQTGEMFDLELEIITAKGNHRLVRAMGEGNKFKGKVVTVSGVFQDITDRKETEEKFKILFETSRDAIMTLAPPDWRFTFGNPATFELFGVKDEKQFDTLGPYDLSPEYQPDGQLSSVKAKKMIEIAMDKGSNFFEWTHKKYRGPNFFATVLLSRITVGEKVYLQATVRDITEQKNIEGALRESESKYRLIIEATGTGYLILDTSGAVVDANPEYVRMTCHKNLSEIKGRSVVEWTAEHAKVANAAAVVQCVKDGFIRNFVTEYDCGAGRIMSVEINANVVGTGESARIVSVCRDITEQKRTEKELHEKMEELEKMNKLMVGRELKMTELKEKLAKK